MRKKFFAKILISALIFAQAALAPLSAFAQFGVSNKVPTQDGDLYEVISGKKPSLISNPISSFEQFTKALDLALDTTTSIVNGVKCSDILKAATDILNKADDFNSWTFGGLSLVTGSAGEVAMLKGKIVSLNNAKTCVVDKQLAVVEKIKPGSILEAQAKQTAMDDLTKQRENIKLRLDQMNMQLRQAQGNFWKSVVVATLLKTTKLVSQRLVNTLTSKYKINNVMQYADAVASQVYTTQLILSKATDKQDQLILRSLATNPLLRTKIDSAIYQRAADALEINGEAFSTRGMSADDPDLYLKLAKFGDPNTSVPYLKTTYNNRSREMSAIGKASAQNEILLGSGLKAPRTCEGNVSTQNAIDQEWAQVNDQMQNRLALYWELEDSYDTRYKSLSPKDQQQLATDFKKAEADYLNAAAKLKEMPTKYENPVLDICKAIASPAEMVNKGIDKAFGKFADNLGDYKTENLPFFMNFISDIGSNIASDLIFGGDVKATLLQESGNISTAINLGINFADAQTSQKNMENGIDFYFVPSTTNPNGFTIKWEILPVIDDVAYVTVSGPGVSSILTDSAGRPVVGPTGQPLVNKFLGRSGSKFVEAPNGGTYSLRVFNNKDQALSNTGGLTVPKPQSAALANPATTPTYRFPSRAACILAENEVYCDSETSLYPPGGVRGVFVKRPSEPPRGYKTEQLR